MTSGTAKLLAEMSDEGRFERLATAVLREAEERYSSLVHPGVNVEGKTVKAPLDGITFVPGAQPAHLIAVHHTTTKASDLKSKWLHDPATVKPRRGNRPTAPAGDLVKTANIVAEERVRNTQLDATLVLTTNLARPSTNVRHIRSLLEASGHPVSEQQGYLAVNNFFEWFHDDIFIYHSRQIAEFLNNIRWAIYDYLRPEFVRSWHLTERATPDFPIYAYEYPDGCVEPVARAMYWDVMNRVRAKPWLHRFIVSESFKQRY